MNAVLMGLQLSIDQIPEGTQDPVEADRRSTLKDIYSACSAALEILNELLLFDKLESGLAVLSKQSVLIKRMVYESIEIFAAAARQKNILLVVTNNKENRIDYVEEGNQSARSMATSLHMDSPRQELTTGVEGVLHSISTSFVVLKSLEIREEDEVLIDHQKLVQVMRNLVSNALKFTPVDGQICINMKFVPAKAIVRSRHMKRGSSASPAADGEGNSAVSGLARLSFRTATTNPLDKEITGELVIEVTDNGAGISAENQRKLFKEIVQFHPERLQNGGGSGFGKPIFFNIPN